MADGDLTRAPADPSDPRGAWDWFVARAPSMAAQRDQVEREAAGRARTVTRVATEHFVDDVVANLEAFARMGAPWHWVQARLDQIVRRRFGNRAGSHDAAIFRTNVQTAYNAARFVQMANGSAIAARPFWRYLAVLDFRTTETCASRDRVIRPAGDPWWRRNWPPLHFNCRSTVVPLTEAEARAFGGVRPLPDLPPVPEGFGDSPDEVGPSIAIIPEFEP